MVFRTDDGYAILPDRTIVDTSGSSTSTGSKTTTTTRTPSYPSVDTFIKDIVSGDLTKKVVESGGYTPPPTNNIQPAPTVSNEPIVGPSIQGVEKINPVATFQQPPPILYPFRDITFFYKKDLPPTIKDVTGTKISKSEYISYTKYAPGYTDIQKLNWIQRNIKKRSVRNVSPLEVYKTWRITPDQSGYSTVQASFSKQYSSGKSSLESLLSTREQIESGEPNVEWGFDLNNNGIIEDSEVFSKEKAYDIVNKSIFETRVGLASISYTSKVLKEYEEAGYGLKETDTGFKFTTLSAKQAHEKIYGKGLSESRFVAKQAMNLGFSALFNVGRWEKYEEEEYSRLLDLSMKPSEHGTNVGSYFGRFWTSPEAIESFWIPAATFGAGYSLSAVSKGALSATKIGTAARIGMKGLLGGIGVVGVSMAGMTVASTAMYDPEHLGTVGGHLVGGAILAAGGFVLGRQSYISGFKPKTVGGKPTYNVRLDVSDTQIKYTSLGKKVILGETGGKPVVAKVTDTLLGNRNRGVLGKFKAYADVMVEGEKPGTYLKNTVAKKYLITLRGSGRGGIPISDTLQISESRGWFYDTFGRGGKPVSAFETYGKNTVPVEHGKTGLKVSAEKFISGSYGPYPDVYEGGGLSWTKPLGRSVVPIEVGTGKIGIKAFGKFDITGRVSIGSFESNLVRGNYFETGISKLFKGFQKGGISVETPKVSGLENFLSDSSGYLRAFTKSPSFAESMFRGNIISSSVGQTISSGLGFGKIGIVPISVSDFGIVGAVGLGSIVKPKTINVQSFKPINIQKSLIVPVVKIEPVTDIGLEPETIMINKTGAVNISKVGTGLVQVPKVEPVVVPKLGNIIVPKTKTIQLQKQASVLLQKTEPIAIQKITPVVVPPVVVPPVVPKIVIPFIPSGESSVGKSWKGGFLWFGKGYRYREWKVPTLESLFKGWS